MPAREFVAHVEAADGTSFDLTVYPPEDAVPPCPVVLIGPAMGVRASYYAPLAEAFRDEGVVAATLELRGHGTSSVRAGHGSDFGYREIVELDFPAALAAFGESFPQSPVFAVGHSLGGQLACLHAAAHLQAFAGIALIGACSVHHRGWPFPHNVGVLVFQQLAWLVARVFGYFPGTRLGFGGREAPRLLRDWSHQGRTGRYEVAGSRHDYETLLAAVTLPVLAIAFTDDAYCPRRATEHLLRKMPAARKRLLHLAPRELGVAKVGHFSWVKRPHLVVPRVVDWMANGVAFSDHASFR